MLAGGFWGPVAVGGWLWPVVAGCVVVVPWPCIVAGLFFFFNFLLPGVFFRVAAGLLSVFAFMVKRRGTMGGFFDERSGIFDHRK